MSQFFKSPNGNWTPKHSVVIIKWNRRQEKTVGRAMKDELSKRGSHSVPPTLSCRNESNEELLNKPELNEYRAKQDLFNCLLPPCYRNTPPKRIQHNLNYSDSLFFWLDRCSWIC